MIQGNSCADLLLTVPGRPLPDTDPAQPLASKGAWPRATHARFMLAFLFAGVSVARLAWPLQQIGRTGTLTCAPIWVGLACTCVPMSRGRERVEWVKREGGQKQTGEGARGCGEDDRCSCGFRRGREEMEMRWDPSWRGGRALRGLLGGWCTGAGACAPPPPARELGRPPVPGPQDFFRKTALEMESARPSYPCVKV
jgi:hypothetical protein